MPRNSESVSDSELSEPAAKAEIPVPSMKKSNAGKNNMSDALDRRHEYRLAVKFILELLTENIINKEVCGRGG